MDAPHTIARPGLTLLSHPIDALLDLPELASLHPTPNASDPNEMAANECGTGRSGALGRAVLPYARRA
jgi:hypothetical protein